MTRYKKVKLTIANINSMKVGDVYRDTMVPGLLIRAGVRSKSILYSYRTIHGTERKPKIGNYGALTLSAARTIAKEWAFIVAKGEDPSQIKHEAKKKGNPYTLNDLRQRWDSELEKAQVKREAATLALVKQGLNPYDHALKLKVKSRDLANLKPSSIEMYNLCWKKLFGYFGGSYEIHRLTRQELETMHDKLGETSTYLANRTLSFTSNILNRAKLWGLREESDGNPAQGIPKFKEYGRKRYLTPEEVPRFIITAQKWMSSPNREHRAIARLAWLCLFNGARRGEFMNARLSWIDWDNGVLNLPDSKTGERSIILSSENIKVLKNRFEEWKISGAIKSEDWIIQGRQRNKHLKSPKNGWAAFLQEAGLTNLRLHDLRHSFASIGISGGVASLDQIGQILGHSNPKTTLRYSHLMMDAERNITNKTGKLIKDLATET